MKTQCLRCGQSTHMVDECPLPVLPDSRVLGPATSRTLEKEMNTQPDGLQLADFMVSKYDLFPESEQMRVATLLRTQHADIERLGKFYAAWQVWQDKTEWVQEAFKASELGMHRADVLKARIERKDALLRQALDAMQEYFDPDLDGIVADITSELAK